MAAGAPAAAVPTVGVDPRVALASTLQATGTTAVLLGSGVSRAAGIRTGWEVTLDLIRRVAAAESSLTPEVDADPQAWWAGIGRGEPGYDVLVEMLAPTDPVRRAVLRPYFETDRDGEQAEPTAAHRAIAELAAQGRVPVILTTNFDRLMERALTTVGVEPQVVSSPRAVRGMTPLPHAGVTVVKLHGDYASGPLRNTPSELAVYPQAWRTLLRRVLDEYGLLVVGWSAEYDTALAQALAEGAGRRYAWYWAAHRGALGEDAARLAAGHGAHVISSAGADELLTDLADRVRMLDRVASRRARPRRAEPQPGRQGLPAGWACLPLVTARVVLTCGPAPADETADIDPRFRARLAEALAASPLTALLRRAAAGTAAASARADSNAGLPARQPPDALDGWISAPGYHQTTQLAGYRLGGDGTAGPAGLVSVTGPSASYGPVSRLTADVGLSLVGGVDVVLLGGVLRDTLVALGDTAALALDELLPAGAEVIRADAHWTVPTDDGAGLNRPVPAGAGLVVSLFGDPSRPAAAEGAYAEMWDGPVTPAAAAEFAHRAMTRFALDSGFLDPAAGLEELREALRPA